MELRDDTGVFSISATSDDIDGDEDEDAVDNGIYKCKKLQFIHKLTSSDTSKTAKITKR